MFGKADTPEEAGKIIEVIKMYFDTNAKPHHHFYHQDSGKLEDIHIDEIKIKKRPKIPRGCKLDSIEVLINLD